jgi:hypothetical protein
VIPILCAFSLLQHPAVWRGCCLKKDPFLRQDTRLGDEDIADAEELLIELTDTQIWVFSQLKSVRNPLILGAAGTGKTVLAIERARRLAADGFSVLLVCYNELLGKRLGEELADERRVRACTFHALCLGEAAQARLPIPAERDERWWEEGAPELLIEAAALEGTTFDAIIVDEGQDFCQLWFESLRLLAQGAQDAPFYVFADWHQQLYRRSWEAPADWTRLELDINCRSTLPIAARVAGIFGEAPASKGAEGPAPRFYEIDVAREGIRFVQRFVSRLLLEEGLAPKQICVLTDDAGVVARLRELLAGDKPFVPMGGHGVVIETVARSKGLEAEAIVLMLTDGLQDGLEGRAALYTAMAEPGRRCSLSARRASSGWPDGLSSPLDPLDQEVSGFSSQGRAIEHSIEMPTGRFSQVKARDTCATTSRASGIESASVLSMNEFA